MKSLYYIAPRNALDRFDEQFEDAEILATPFEADAIRSLTASIKSERAISQQDFVIIDVADMTRWSVGHVLSATQLIRSFASCKLIFIGQPCADVEELFRCLRDAHHIDDVILAPADADVSKPLMDCLVLTAQSSTPPPLTPEAKLNAAQQTVAHATPVLRKLGAPQGTLEIYVAGTMPRCGTTTQVFGIYHYLTACGLRGAIRDRAGTLPLLSQFEVVSKTPDGDTMIRDIPFVGENVQSGGHDFIVTDCGVLSEVPEFCGANISVLVGCTKPWELPQFAEAIKRMFGYQCRYLVTIASFSVKEDLQKLQRYLGDHYAIAPYQPDLWRLANADVYQNLFEPALERCCAAAEYEGLEHD